MAQTAIEAPAIEAESPPKAGAGASADGKTQDDGIIHIVVTAQGREQALQNVPISITAVTAETLQSMGADSVEELAVTTPSLTLTGRAGTATPAIRGVGSSTNNGGTESAVAVYIDGAYIPSIAGMKFSFNNIERIEVLKGPQGTLFGRNATGGLINIVTREPTAKPTLIAGLRYDDYQTAEQSLYGSIGLAQNLAGDLAVFHSDQNEGYGRNKADGREVYEGDETGLRSSLLWTPAAQTRLRLSADYTHVDTSKGVARQVDRGARTFDGQGPQSDYRDVNNNIDPFYLVEGGGLALKATREFDGLQLLGLSSYRDGRNHFLIDVDATAVALVQSEIREENRSFTQTLQLQSTDTGPLSWVAGLYYFDYDVDFELDVSGFAFGAVGGQQITTSSLNTQSYAAYAEATLALQPSTHLTLGLRHTRDERRYKGFITRPNAVDPVPGFAQGSAPPAFNDEEPTWRVALDRRFNDRVLGYVSYNRGFGSGNYTLIDANAPAVKSEILDAYELGVKTDLLDRKLRLNAALFWNDYENQQIRTFGGAQGSTRLGSVPRSRIRGGEIELSWLATERLDVNVGVALLDTELTDFPDGDISEPKPAPEGGNYFCRSGGQTASATCPESVRPTLAAQTVEGNELPRAPDFTGTLGIAYRQPVAYGELGFSASAAHNGGFYWAVDNRSEQDAYTLINAQLDWKSPSRRYRVYAFGKNLGDEEYSQFLTSDSLGDIATAAAPRTIGLGTELRFE
ncbi:MAG: TonB-dependent receptor [Panacagrimonas sp.]